MMAGRKPLITVVSFIGRPLAGKDYQAAVFKNTYEGVATISTGEKLRDQEFLMRTFTPEEVMYINETRDAGKNVRDDIAQRINHEAILDEARKGNRMIILTGNPRTIPQYNALNDWEKEERKKGEFRFDNVYIKFQIDQDKTDLRREERIHREGRADDKDEQSVKSRHATFDTNIPPMLTEVSRRSHIWHRRLFTINADQKPDEVTLSLERILRHHHLPKRRKTLEGRPPQVERVS